MKKILAIISAILLIVSLSLVITGCNSNSVKQFFSGKEPSSIEDEANENGIVGGWTKVESPVITDEFKAVFDKATSELTGMTYEPVAYLEMQVVGGFNYRVLCKGTATVPNAETCYSIITIYEDPSHNAKITSMTDSTIPAPSSEAIPGGWTATDSPELTDEVKKVFEKATETLTGAELNPVALLATQVVAGTNYELLCEMTATVPNAIPEYAIVHIYADLNGNAEITEIKEFVPDEAPDSEGESEATSADSEQ